MRYFQLFSEAAPRSTGDYRHATALAMHILTGMPLYALMVMAERIGPKRVAHIMVRSSDDVFIDSDGHHSLLEIIGKSGAAVYDEDARELLEITPDVLINWSDGKMLPKITRGMVSPAYAAANEILGRLGIPRQ